MNVSVILPVYNGSQYLHAAVDSILLQSHSALELIILNDGSTEDIESVLENFSDPRIRYYSRENRGLGHTLNELVQLSRYDIIFRMDADDIAEPNRISTQLLF